LTAWEPENKRERKPVLWISGNHAMRTSKSGTLKLDRDLTQLVWFYTRRFRNPVYAVGAKIKPALYAAPYCTWVESNPRVRIRLPKVPPPAPGTISYEAYYDVVRDKGAEKPVTLVLKIMSYSISLSHAIRCLYH